MRQDVHEVLGRERTAELLRFSSARAAAREAIIKLEYRPKPYKLDKAAWLSWGILIGAAMVTVTFLVIS